jgi:hypothetical protein
MGALNTYISEVPSSGMVIWLTVHLVCLKGIMMIKEMIKAME